MKDFFRNTVIMLSLISIGAFAAWLYLRPEIPRGSELSDGETEVSKRRLREELRLALWEEPHIFSRDLQSDLTETDPSFDASTGRFYFVLGEPGLDQDLWVAVPQGDGFRFDRLDDLNTTFNESAPTFHQGYLYFATNRPGGHGGLDLMRSRFTDDGFLEPENLGTAINTSADETDPEFRPGTRDLYFASNRDSTVGVADFDIHCAVTDGDRFSDSIEITHSTPYDERSPAFAADGRVLVFSSNRPDGIGGFDLYQMLQRGDDWREPEALEGPNTPADEWAPALADGGFTLYFSSDRTADANHREHDIYVARTRELFAIQGGGLSLLDITILFLLVLVALLAYLARRWSALDIIYKCLLASILLHLLLLWLSRRVDIEVEEVPLPTGIETYEVQLLSNLLDAAQRMEDQERGENVSAPAPTSTTELVRARPSPAHVATPTQQVAELQRADTSSADAPSATPTQVAPQFADASAAASPVQTFEEAYERIQGSVPQMTVSGESVETPDASAEPMTVRSETATTPSDAPSTSHQSGPALARAEISSTAPAAQSVQRSPAVSPARAQSVQTAAVNDRVERSVHEGLTAMTVQASETATSAPRGDLARPERSSTSVSNDSLPTARPTSEVPLVRADGTRTHATQAPTRRTTEASPGLAAANPGSVSTEVPRDRIEGAMTADAAPAEMQIGPTTTSASQVTRSDTTRSASPMSALSGPTDLPDVTPTNTSQLARAGRNETTSQRPPTPTMTQRSMSSGSPGSVAMSQPQDRIDAGGAATTAPASAVATLSPSQVSTPRTSAGDLAPTRLPTRLNRGEPNVRPTETGASLSRSTSIEHAAPQRTPALSRRGQDLSTRPSAARVVDATPLPVTERGGGGSDPSASLDSLAGAPRSFALPGGRTRAARPSRAQFVLADPGLPTPSARPLSMPELTKDPTRLGPDRDATLYERRTGTAKKTALERGGGSEETERAVIAGLRYLARIQRRNGSFGDSTDGTERQKYRDVRMGKTGLVALAFLGGGHTPTSDTEFSDNVTRALAWILAQQDPNSGHFGNNAGYGHGIATYAVAECYAMTRDRRYLPYLMRAVRHILDQQILSSSNRKLVGGWRYYYPEGPGGPDPYPRASLSSWQVMALESAKAGGVPVPDDALDAARDYFRNCYDRQYGYFRYNHNPDWLENPSGYRTLPASTPASMFVLSLLGQQNDSMMDTAARYVMDRVPSGYRYRGNDAFARQATGNLYFWYYGSLAMFLRGGQDWRRWNEAMKSTLLPAQNLDGSWTEISAYGTDYAGDDSRERTYTTAISVLTLEVYYRYFTPQLMRQGR